MYKVVEVSDETLKKDIKKSKRLRNKSFSMSVYYAKEQLERRSDEILTSFLDGDLQLKPKQYALFAKYIEEFCNGNQDRYFDKLQKMADFDVRESLKKEKVSWWQKFLKGNPNEIKLSAKKMKKSMDKYLKTQRRLERGLAPQDLYGKSERMRQEGEDYIKAYVDGKITIKPEDVELFKKFIKVMDYPIYDGCLGDRALKKLANEAKDVVIIEKPQKKSWFAGIKQTISTKLEALKEKSPLYAKIATGITVIATSTILLISKGSGNDNSTPVTDKNINQTEQKTSAATDSSEIDNNDSALIYKWQPVSTYEMKEIAPQKSKVEVKDSLQEDKIDAKRQALINHHNHVLKMRIGEQKRKAIEGQIKAKIKNGIFTLPDSICIEEFSYAMEMYNAYGIDCSLDEALNSTQKLSAEANEKIVQEIVAAGETGLGVKKMAEKKYNGKMNNNSVYDRASVKSQKKHNMNLKQWRQAKKAASHIA